jgi:hypothetical protein
LVEESPTVEGRKAAERRAERGHPRAAESRKEQKGRKGPPKKSRKGQKGAERGHPTIKWIDVHFLVQIDDQLIDRAKNRGCARRVRVEIAESAQQRS